MRKALLLASLLVFVVVLAVPSFAAAETPEATQTQQVQVTAVSVDQPVQLTTDEMAAVTGEHGTVKAWTNNPVSADLWVRILGGMGNWRGAHVHVIVPLSWRNIWRGGGYYEVAVLR